MQGDPLALVSNEVTKQSPGWFRDQPSAFGVKIDNSIIAPPSSAGTVDEEKIKVKSTSDTVSKSRNDLMDHIQEGVITMGAQKFNALRTRAFVILNVDLQILDCFVLLD